MICNSGWIDARGAMDVLADSLPKGWKMEKRYFSDGAASRTIRRRTKKRSSIS